MPTTSLPRLKRRCPSKPAVAAGLGRPTTKKFRRQCVNVELTPWPSFPGLVEIQTPRNRMNKKDLSERDICSKFIGPAVKRAGWDGMMQIREEVRFQTIEPMALLWRRSAEARS